MDNYRGILPRQPTKESRYSHLKLVYTTASTIKRIARYAGHFIPTDRTYKIYTRILAYATRIKYLQLIVSVGVTYPEIHHLISVPRTPATTSKPNNREYTKAPYRRKGLASEFVGRSTQMCSALLDFFPICKQIN